MMMRPFTMPCRYTATFNITNMLFTTPKIKAPKKVPKIVPLPPLKLVPPITAAAMASNSKPLPVDEELTDAIIEESKIADVTTETPLMM